MPEQVTALAMNPPNLDRKLQTLPYGKHGDKVHFLIHSYHSYKYMIYHKYYSTTLKFSLREAHTTISRNVRLATGRIDRD